MTIPARQDLADLLSVLTEWQVEGLPMQLHPGDVGWFGRFGTAATIDALRVWTREGRVRAVGLRDGPDLLRVAMAPEAVDDVQLARAMAGDLTDPAHGVLPKGEASVEAPARAVLQEALAGEGWHWGEAWLQLRRDLPVDRHSSTLRVATVGTEAIGDRVAVERAAFASSRFSEEHWRAMASGPAYPRARCLVGYDNNARAVATITVWSAGPDRPGLIEPMGVHEDHRGRGHGRSMTLAGAQALQELGASSVWVATPTAWTGAVRTYLSAGFAVAAEVRDRTRTVGRVGAQTP